jgi:LmbE family N-acetylglucosaminyl deacetylase
MVEGPVLVIAPHPDDEVLGAGGTISRHVDEGREVVVVIVTRGDPSMFDPALVQRTREEAAEAAEVLGVKPPVFLEGFPAALLDTVPAANLNAALAEIMRELRPDTVYLPFAGDMHLDHRLVARAAVVAARPSTGWTPRQLYSYEAVSETHWSDPLDGPSFDPTVYVDIAPHLERKLEAAARYQTQLRPFPHERSLEAIRALATVRGATVGFEAAEAFVLVRAVEPLEEV